MSNHIVFCFDCKNYRLCVKSGRVQSASEPICENFSIVTCGDCLSYEYCMNMMGFESDEPICECFHHKEVVQNG